jgi:hypothetical protein
LAEGFLPGTAAGDVVTMRAVTATVHDPHLYALSNLEDRVYCGLLLQFLRTSIRSNVMLMDDAGQMVKCFRIRTGELASKDPVIKEMLTQCLKRIHLIPSNGRIVQTMAKLKEWAAPECVDNMARVATLSLAGEPCAEAVYASKETLEIAEVCEEIAGRDKVRTLSAFEDTTAHGGLSIFKKSGADVETEVFGPVLKWGERVFLVDKHIATSFADRQNNWDIFKRTIGWLYRCWVSRTVVQRERFVVLTYPPKDAKGRMGSPSLEMAHEMWKALDSLADLTVEIVKVGRERDDKIDDKVKVDISHPRYLVTMPMDFTLCVDRGFDLLGAKGNVVNACNVALMPNRPDDLVSVLNLRKSGVSYPS